MQNDVISLHVGKNIVSPNDPLSRISIEDLYHLVKQPTPDLASKIQQLRTVQIIEPKRYQVLKRMLPYVTCGIFNPPYRRTENFASINCFIVDIDHLSQKEIDLTTLRDRLKSDNRIHLLFISPGNDGLKLVFWFNEKCYDSGHYSLFYKLFVTRFSQEYGLEQSVDKVTSDVTRACFLSADEDAWYNPFAAPVCMEAYINFDNYTSIENVQKELALASEKIAVEQNETEKSLRQALPDDLMRDIREKLNPNVRLKREKQIFVPDELTVVVNSVEEKMKEFGINTKRVESIHYGKKFVFELGLHWAQLNLFYGKQGFKIVKTPANGSNAELAEITYKILCEIFY